MPVELAENAGPHALLDQLVDPVRGGRVLAVDLCRRLVPDHVVVERVGVPPHGRADAGEVDPNAPTGVGIGLDGLLDLGGRVPEEGQGDRRHQLLFRRGQAVQRRLGAPEPLGELIHGHRGEAFGQNDRLGLAQQFVSSASVDDAPACRFARAPVARVRGGSSPQQSPTHGSPGTGGRSPSPPRASQKGTSVPRNVPGRVQRSR